MKWILLVLFASPSFAALPVVLPKAIPFYKNAKSVFTSGQCSREDLEKNILRTEAEVNFRVNWGRREFALKENDLLRDVQLLKTGVTKDLTVLRGQPQSQGKYLGSLKTKTFVDVLAINSDWALVRAKQLEGWMSLANLEPQFTDQGFAYTLIDTYLRAKPSLNARLLTTISQGTRIPQFRFEKNWLHVKLGQHQGYIDLGHVYLRADFARWAHHKKLGWVQVQHREFSQLRTQDNLLFPVEEFTAFIPDSHRAFVLNPQPQGPQKRSRVEIKKIIEYRWAVSRLKDHGEVWWKMENENFASQSAAQKENWIKTDELLKRSIFSMAFTDSQKVQGLVSAKGIYRTDDGIRWQKLESFGNHDYPVAVHKDGAWFVGSYRSLDSGKTFEPFIRWDRVADVLGQHNVNVGSMVKILRIESLKTPFIEILMDTGSRRVSLQTHILNQTWRAVK